MAPLSNLLLISAVASASAFAPSTPVTQTARVQTRPAQADTKVFENFGFDFAEDQTENTASVILGEARYKQWVGEVVDPDNSFVNRQVRLGSTQWRHSIGACFTAMKAYRERFTVDVCPSSGRALFFSVGFSCVHQRD
mmetsp:Transcript_20916/g.60910  ORF Transcript_20916/g.60910 Transcript_20916/m.60910 type:complete len:138 (-) Transcript_20916:144-557(-)